VPAEDIKPSRLSVGSWVLYDLANTIFALGVVGFYFSDWLISEGQPDSALAAVQIGAAIVVVFLAPWAGARSDLSGTRIPTLIMTTLVAVVATSLMAVGPVMLTLFLLWIAVIGVNTGSVVYDALLVDVSTPENRGFISGLGVGVGYVGSFVGLAIGTITLEVLGWNHAATFRTLAAAFLLFALPAFFFIRERPGTSDGKPLVVGEIVSRLVASWRKAGTYDSVVPFLVGRFFYTDAINTLIGGFLAIFVIDELGMDRGSFTILLGVAIGAAILGGLGAGPVVTRFGPLRVLRWVLVLWMAAMTTGIVASVTGWIVIAWLIGPLGGIALGATWTSDRVVMTRVSPPRYLGEFYGLYATVGRFATIAGPLVWAIVVDLLDLGRNAALGALIGFIVVGWRVLGRVDDAERQWGPEERPLLSGDPDALPS
jgi:UMF1 family MFS transporter